LLDIALRHGMDWTVVAAANGLGEHSLLQIGQTVRIPGSGEASAAPGTGGLAARTGEPYTVQAGETLFSIAAQNGLTWQELAAFNGLGENDVLQIDQVIQLPVAEASEADVEPETDDAPVVAAAGAVMDAAPQVVTLREGDTVFSVALAHGVDWLEVLSLNGLSEDSLVQPGQQIRLR
jgi:peptidoglycan endopeptidase LytF